MGKLTFIGMSKLRVNVEKRDRRMLISESETDSSSSSTSSDSSESEGYSSESSVERLGSTARSSTSSEDEERGRGLKEEVKSDKGKEKVSSQLKRKIEWLEERVAKRGKFYLKGRENLLIETIDGMRKVNWGTNKDSKARIF
jgi:hypothetical protein